ncbi:hypothetical protein HYS97_00305 [Candidatus Daviesbacteria bacterium]|nr:hypothetical protein [Candidatus Daviesbacteria bacterium]
MATAIRPNPVDGGADTEFTGAAEGLGDGVAVEETVGIGVGTGVGVGEGESEVLIAGLEDAFLTVNPSFLKTDLFKNRIKATDATITTSERWANPLWEKIGMYLD